MRKYLTFVTAVAAIALGAALWAKSAAVVATDGMAQPQTGISPYEMMRNTKELPQQQITDYY
jgi:hypothetical protein